MPSFAGSAAAVSASGGSHRSWRSAPGPVARAGVEGARGQPEVLGTCLASSSMTFGSSRPTDAVIVDWCAPPSGASVAPDGVSATMKRALTPDPVGGVQVRPTARSSRSRGRRWTPGGPRPSPRRRCCAHGSLRRQSGSRATARAGGSRRAPRYRWRSRVMGLLRSRSAGCA